MMIKKQSKYEILTPSGWKDFDGIRVSIDTRKLYNIISEEGLIIEVTDNHKIKTPNGFIEASNLIGGSEILTQFGADRIAFISPFISDVPVYDLLEVKDGNEYYTSGFVSHNCEFLGSSGTLISGEALKRLMASKPIWAGDGIKQYEKPIDDHVYVITVDVSRGKGLDYSTFSVFDSTQMPYKQVLTFRDNYVSPGDYSSIIFKIGRLYNNAHVLVEINDIGGQVSDSLFMDFGYDEMLMTENYGRMGKRIAGGFGGKKVDRGLRTTKITKIIGCSLLKLLVEQQQLIINDEVTIEELKRFSKKGTGYEAEPGYHDDTVMVLVLYAWLTNQMYFKELTDINTLAMLRDKSEKQIEDDLLPFGFIDDGGDDTQGVVVETVDWGVF